MKKIQDMLSIGEKYKQTSSSLLFATVGQKFSSSNLSLTIAAMLDVLTIQSSVISGKDLV